MPGRVILGAFDGTYGLKVSKPGVEVLTAGPGDLLFDSRADFFRVLARGTVYFAQNQWSAPIAFNLPVGWSPVLEIMAEAGGSSIFTKAGLAFYATYSGQTVTLNRNDYFGGQAMQVQYLLMSVKGV